MIETETRRCVALRIEITTGLALLRAQVRTMGDGVVVLHDSTLWWQRQGRDGSVR